MSDEELFRTYLAALLANSATMSWSMDALVRTATAAVKAHRKAYPAPKEEVYR